METLFNTTFESEPWSHHEAGLSLKAQTCDLLESNVHIQLTLVETVGYGDQPNKRDCFKVLEDYLDYQFNARLKEEVRAKRTLAVSQDTWVHVALYFITPNGNGLKNVDLVCMKKLHQKVNFLPIIAKADTLKRNELVSFKAKILA